MEIDLWGKARKGIRAQQAEYKASEADYRAGYLSLISEVASTYFQIRQFDEQIARQQAGLAKNQRILGILERQRQEGLVANTWCCNSERKTVACNGICSICNDNGR